MKTVRPAAPRRTAVVKKGFALMGLAAVSLTAVGCAVSLADTVGEAGHRADTSIFSTFAGVTTSEVTSAFASTTSARVVDGSFLPAVDGALVGDLAGLSQDAAWSLTLNEKIEGMRLGPMYGAETAAPIQIGNVMLVGMRSSVLNQAGTAAFSMKDGSLLWQDRSLECQRVDLGGALPCRQNSGAWAPFNPQAAAFGEAFNPGFAPEAFGFADGVLYSARTNGAGMIEVAAGTIAEPAKHWTVKVPRSMEAMLPGQGARIEIAENLTVVMGSAQIEITKSGQPLAQAATPVTPKDGAMVADMQRVIGDVHVRNSVDDRVSTHTWSVPSRVVSEHTVTDGRNLTFVAGDQADGTNAIRTISLQDGYTVNEHGIVAGAHEPRDIQSAAHGIFAYDKQFSRIAYYPAG